MSLHILPKKLQAPGSMSGALDQSGGTDQPDPSQGLVSGTGQVSADDVQRFVNSGGFANALAQNPAAAQMMRSMLQQTAQKASVDQQRLDDLGKKFGLGTASGQTAQAQSLGGTAQAQSLTNPLTGGSAASPGFAQTQSFNPLVGNSLSSPSSIANNGADLQLQDLAALGGGGGTFEDRVFAIMCKVTEDYQNQIEQRLQGLQDQAQSAQSTTAAGGQDTGSESRNIEFEKLKYDMQKLSQMQQAMSNVLDSMNDLAMNAIRKINK